MNDIVFSSLKKTMNRFYNYIENAQLVFYSFMFLMAISNLYLLYQGTYKILFPGDKLGHHIESEGRIIIPIVFMIITFFVLIQTIPILKSRGILSINFKLIWTLVFFFNFNVIYFGILDLLQIEKLSFNQMIISVILTLVIGIAPVILSFWISSRQSISNELDTRIQTTKK